MQSPGEAALAHAVEFIDDGQEGMDVQSDGKDPLDLNIPRSAAVAAPLPLLPPHSQHQRRYLLRIDQRATDVTEESFTCRMCLQKVPFEEDRPYDLDRWIQHCSSEHHLPYVLGCSPILYDLIQPSREDDPADRPRRSVAPSLFSEADNDNQEEPPLRPAPNRRVTAKQGNMDVETDTDADAVLPDERIVAATKTSGKLRSAIGQPHVTRPLPNLVRATVVPCGAWNCKTFQIGASTWARATLMSAHTLVQFRVGGR